MTGTDSDPDKLLHNWWMLLLDCEKNIKSLKELKAELLLREKNYRTAYFIQHPSFTDCIPTYFHHSCFPFSVIPLKTFSITSLIRFVICVCSSFHSHTFCLPYASCDTSRVFNAAFFFYLHCSPQRRQKEETQKDKETLCNTGDSSTDSRPHKTLQGWEIDKNHHSNPLRESVAQSTVDLTPDQPHSECLQRCRWWGPCERVAWVRDDHRPVVIYLCWLVALSSSAWVAHCSIIHETDDWLWQDAEPGGVCVCLVCIVTERTKLQNVKKRGFWFMCANNKNIFTASAYWERVHNYCSIHFIT